MLAAVTRVEGVHPNIVQDWIECACVQAADPQVITGVRAENVELDELHSFAGAKLPEAQASDLAKVDQH